MMTSEALLDRQFETPDVESQLESPGQEPRRSTSDSTEHFGQEHTSQNLGDALEHHLRSKVWDGCVTAFMLRHQKTSLTVLVFVNLVIVIYYGWCSVYVEPWMVELQKQQRLPPHLVNALNLYPAVVFLSMTVQFVPLTQILNVDIDDEAAEQFPRSAGWTGIFFALSILAVTFGLFFQLTSHRVDFARWAAVPVVAGLIEDPFLDSLHDALFSVLETWANRMHKLMKFDEGKPMDWHRRMREHQRFRDKLKVTSVPFLIFSLLSIVPNIVLCVITAILIVHQAVTPGMRVICGFVGIMSLGNVYFKFEPIARVTYSCDKVRKVASEHFGRTKDASEQNHLMAFMMYLDGADASVKVPMLGRIDYRKLARLVSWSSIGVPVVLAATWALLSA